MLFWVPWRDKAIKFSLISKMNVSLNDFYHMWPASFVKEARVLIDDILGCQGSTQTNAHSVNSKPQLQNGIYFFPWWCLEASRPYNKSFHIFDHFWQLDFTVMVWRPSSDGVSKYCLSFLSEMNCTLTLYGYSTRVQVGNRTQVVRVAVSILSLS